MMRTTAFSRRLIQTLLGGLAMMSISAEAQTLWTNTSITFKQFNPNASDFLTTTVSLTRGGNGTLLNDSTSPTPDTVLWAEGTIQNFGALNYQPMANYRNGNLQAVLFANSWVMWLTNANIYIPVTFSAWGQHGAGGWTYTRGTAPAVAPPTPSVFITNPAASAVFAAPANLKLGASATVSSGTVTNVAFFANGSPVGSVTNTPFNVTSSTLGEGSFALMAVATAAGVSATSAVVNVTVINPVAVSLSASTVSNGVFSFNYTADSGLKYVVQSSSNLTTWLPVVTNVAASSPVPFTSGVSNGAQFYRVGRLPNP